MRRINNRFTQNDCVYHRTEPTNDGYRKSTAQSAERNRDAYVHGVADEKCGEKKQRQTCDNCGCRHDYHEGGQKCASSLGGGLSALLRGLIPAGLDAADMLLLLILLFLFIESGDEEFLIILIVVAVSMFGGTMFGLKI